MLRSAALLLVAGLAVSVAEPASADVPPPDACTTVGTTCNNAGSSHNQPGTCVASTCTRPTPDGSLTYACSRCVVGSATGGAAGVPDAGKRPTSSASGGCGCTLSVSPEPTGAVLASALMLGWLVVRRRRRA